MLLNPHEIPPLLKGKSSSSRSAQQIPPQDELDSHSFQDDNQVGGNGMGRSMGRPDGENHHLMMEKWDLMGFYSILMGFNGIYDGYPLVV